MLLGAPTNIGIRPYDNGAPRRLDLAPAALRDRGVVTRLGAADLGDISPRPYRDFARPGRGIRNEREVADYSRALAERLAPAMREQAFVVMLGGDCSIVLGALLGAREAGLAAVGLAYVDAHGDFATPELSASGSAASMCLALATGRGESGLARLGGPEPLVRDEDVAIVGRHDEAYSPIYGQELIRASRILDVTADQARVLGASGAANTVLRRVAANDLSGFWIHLDADALDPSVLTAVDSPEPGGFDLDTAVALLRPLARHPKALGIEVTIYDPALDHNDAGERLVCLLERVIVP